MFEEYESRRQVRRWIRSNSNPPSIALCPRIVNRHINELYKRDKKSIDEDLLWALKKIAIAYMGRSRGANA